MIIRAIRVAETGPFLAPVCVEGFSGKLDVLVAPNEAGKSTLLTALSTLIGEKHTSSARAIAALKPDAGGAPLIEADLEFGGRLFRVRKRYISQRSAEVADLERGQIWRGADAETELERLLGSDGSQAIRGLMWVRQGDSFSLPTDKDEAMSAGLAQLIEAETADSAGGGAARRVAQLVKERLGLLVTAAQGKAKANSDLDKALRRRDEVYASLEQARARANAVEGRRHRLDALRLELQNLTGEAGLVALKERSDRAVEAVRKADDARDKLKMARERVAARQLAVDAARQAVERLSAHAQEAQDIRSRIVAAQSDFQELDRRRQMLAASVSSGEQMREKLYARVDNLRTHVQRFQLDRMRALEVEALTVLTRNLDEVRAAAPVIARARERLSSNRVTDDVVRDLRELVQQIASLDARIAAEAPVVTINYKPGVSKGFSIDGQPLGESRRIAVDGRVVIEVAGLGSIEIASAMVNRAENAVAEREAKRAALSALLGAHGVTDIGEAVASAQARQQDVAIVRAAEQRLAALAPHGLDQLDQAVSAQAAKVAALTGEIDGLVLRAQDTFADGATAQTALLEAQQAADAATQQSEASRSTLAEVVSRAAIAQERVAADERRLEQVERELGPNDTRELRRKEADEALAAANSVLSEAVREVSSWTDAVPNEEIYTRLLEAKLSNGRDVDRALSRRASIETEIAEVSGALYRDGEDGSGSDVPRLEEALEVAQARVSDLELDVAALKLLAERLANAGTEQRGRVLKPVIARLEPMLHRLFPGVTVELDGPLLLTRFTRSERVDSMPRLSGGTREQVATMVRLAYAGLLAQQGRAMPVVLDDALVFSDDDRLAVMFDLLASSAVQHQVVMLSCHQRIVEPLIARHGAMALKIEAWPLQVEGRDAIDKRGRR